MRHEKDAARNETREEDETRTDATRDPSAGTDDPDAGARDLDYGHAFGTQRDRSEGQKPDYVEPHHDTVQDEALEERRRSGDAPED